MPLHILSRHDLVHGPFPARGPALLISIRDPNRPKPVPGFTPAASLFLAFHDAEPAGVFAPGVRMMDAHDARAVWDFLQIHHDEGTDIVIQCEGGVSRSAAVGKAVAKAMGHDWRRFDRQYTPNAFVFETLMEEWEAMGRPSFEGASTKPAKP